MSEWNPASVEKQLWETTEEISRNVLAADEAYREMKRTERVYAHSFEVAYLDAFGPAHEKKYRAGLATAEQLEFKDIAEAAYRLVAAQGAALKVKVEVLRSIGTSVRQAYENAGRGEW